MMADDTEMTETENSVDLPEFTEEANPPAIAGDSAEPVPPADDAPGIERESHTASELEAVFDVPVNISAVLGKTQMEVSTLLKLGKGTVIELDRKVGEAIDIFVNDRLVARGEVVLVEEQLGVTMTEIIQAD